MKLRSQLLLVSLSLLVLPWAGWQLLRLLGEVLREGQEQALVASAEALARGMALRASALPPAADAVFAQALPRRPRLDGDADDWPPAAAAAVPLRPTSGAAGDAGRPDAGRVRVGHHDDTVHLWIEVADGTPARTDAHWPIAPRRDHLRLVLHGRQGLVELRLANAESGPLRVVAADGAPAPLAIRGHWQDHDDRYTVELALPQGYPLRALAVTAVDADHQGVASLADTGTHPLAVLQQSPALAGSLGQLVPVGMHAQLLDRNGWLLAEAGTLAAPAEPAAVPGWRRWLYRQLLFPGHESAGESSAAVAGGQADIAWRSLADSERPVLSAQVPVAVAGQVRAQLRLERDGDALLRLTERALSGLFALTLLTLAAVLLSVLWFAGHLSNRIRRLRDAAERALDRDGRVQPFPVVRAGDEIGDLARSFSRLLAQVEGYTGYLRGLAGTLSHELSTPIAMVRGSLDNLEAEPDGPQARTYIERARAGVDRLAALVRAMSAATRIEQAIASADIEAFDLRALVADCAEGYRPLLAPRRLELLLPAGPLPFTGAPDLIAQALDKLIDNARGFCPPDGWVRIELAPAGDGARLAVANTGPPLPAHMRERLFDSMVSVRDQRGDGIHLGLGLHIVKLVAELHRGRVEAHDLAGPAGAEFVVSLTAPTGHAPRVAPRRGG